MKATAVAPANIAFIKYWGKTDEELRLPLNDSLSMNLSGSYTTTTVEFSPAFTADDTRLVDGEFSQREILRVGDALDEIRAKAGIRLHARVYTKNSFPKGAGAAASASGFAALTVAAFAAAGCKLSQKELTIFARLGSGSACRSIPDGFVLWEKGTTSDDSFAYSLCPHTHWDIRDILVIVDSRMKKVSTTDGMKTVSTSPLLAARLKAIPARMEGIKQALAQKDFARLGEIAEEDCLDMHRVMQTQAPPLQYWNDSTRMIMDAVKTWRKAGLPVYFTVDAGSNVHVLCEGRDEGHVLEKVRALAGIESVILNKPAPGAHRIDNHLF